MLGEGRACGAQPLLLRLLLRLLLLLRLRLRLLMRLLLRLLLRLRFLLLLHPPFLSFPPSLPHYSSFNPS